jgi:AraC family transcriptional regulator
VALEWDAFTLQVIDRHEPLQMTVAFADHLLTWQIAGTCRLHRKAEGRSVDGVSGPGSVNIVPAHFKATWECWGSSRNVDLHIPDAFLSRVIEENWDVDPRRVEILPQFLISDRIVETVLAQLKFEAQKNSPSGTQYAESASEFLAHHIVHAHSSLSVLPQLFSGGLTGRRLRIVLDYIQDNISERITLRGLAELAGVSARHFERAFRQSVGVPLNAYVIDQRVATARMLLMMKPPLPVETIATRAGFSSSSHLASAFRRRFGCSPAQFRRHQSR